MINRDAMGVFVPVNSINTGTITLNKSTKFGQNEDGGNNYKSR